MIALLVLGGVSWNLAGAEESNTTQSNAARNAKSPNAARSAASAKSSTPDKSSSEVKTPEGADAALAFAATHHPELGGLLRQLQKANPRAYGDAIDEVNRARERLERFAERQPERYPLELAEWKLASQIRLLVARMTMKDDPALLAELESAVRQRHAIRLQLLQEEQQRLQQRLTRIEEQIADHTDRADDLVTRDLAALRRAANTAATRVGPARPGNKADATGTPRPNTKSAVNAPAPAATKTPVEKTPTEKSPARKPVEKPAKSDKPDGRASQSSND